MDEEDFVWKEGVTHAESDQRHPKDVMEPTGAKRRRRRAPLPLITPTGNHVARPNGRAVGDPNAAGTANQTEGARLANGSFAPP